MQVDKGGIKHVVGGANVMAPGLLTPGWAIDFMIIYLLGGKMDDVEANKIVVEVSLIWNKIIGPNGRGKNLGNRCWIN